MNIQGPEGMLFAGKYRIVKLIGRGGMANVYLGSDINTGLKVAIKIMRPEFATDEEFIRRFDTEAKAVSSLSHANIVKVFGVGHEGNFRYIVQEYVDGITVKELINQNGHLDWKVAVPIVIQVGLALEYAHKNGIVHRDIKPQNILISRDRIAKITDFGIARASTGNTITMSSGGAMGSVHYFSPEQARGGNVGPQSDIYSVGVMLFEMVTGRVPFDGDSNVAIAVKHLQEKPPLASSFVPDIPQGLDAIIQKCMQKIPERRYTSMRQMVTELDALMVDPNGVYGVINNTPTPYDDKSDDDVKLSFRQDPSYDKLSDLEKSAEARRRSRFRDNIILVLIVVCIIGVLIGLGVLVVKSLNNATEITQNDDYTIKNYVGMKYEDVKAELDKYDIECKPDYQEVEEGEGDIVLAQTPSEGTVVKPGSSVTTVRLTVSKLPETPEKFTLADYTGLEYTAVVASLRNMGFETALFTDNASDAEAGTVIRTDPPANSEVEEGQTIGIYYASDKTIVPNLQAMSLQEAEEALRNAKLTGTVEMTEEAAALPEAERYVIRTDPAPDTEVTRNSSIRLYVGTHEDALRGTTPTPTPLPVEVIVETQGAGTVTGGGLYEPGATVELTATPAEGYKLDHWQDSFGNVVSYSSPYRFAVEENHSYRVVAVFVPAPTDTPTPTPSPTPTPVPTNTPTPVPATATPTPTPVPTATPVPTDTPTPIPIEDPNMQPDPNAGQQ